MRVTNISLAFNTERNLQAALGRLANAQDKVGSQQQISRPSDDPSGTANALATRSEIRQNQQHARNVQDANRWLSSTDAALTQATDLLQRVRDLTLRGANDGALSPDAKEAIALELEQLRDQLATTANTQYNGRHLFAGSSDAPMALDPDTWEFADSPSPVQRRIGANTQVRVDSDGAAIFGNGQDSVFALVTSIANDLLAGTSLSARIEQVDARLQAVLGAHATVGASHASTLAAEGVVATEAVALEGRRASIEDTDLSSAILDLKSKEVAYQAALSAAARTLQPSLMDFLR